MATRRKSEPSYSQASAELEQILDEIEDGSADIDVLTDRVERAAHLIKLCRQKLAGTELRVEKIVQELAESVADSEPANEAETAVETEADGEV